MNNFKELSKTYTTKEILLSFATAAIFYLLLAAIFLIPTIVLLLLYVPYTMYFFVGIYTVLSFISVYSTKIFTETLLNYQKNDMIKYDKIQTTLSVIMTIITFITLAITYFSIN